MKICNELARYISFAGMGMLPPEGGDSAGEDSYSPPTDQTSVSIILGKASGKNKEFSLTDGTKKKIDKWQIADKKFTFSIDGAEYSADFNVDEEWDTVTFSFGLKNGKPATLKHNGKTSEITPSTKPEAPAAAGGNNDLFLKLQKLNKDAAEKLKARLDSADVPSDKRDKYYSTAIAYEELYKLDAGTALKLEKKLTAAGVPFLQKESWYLREIKKLNAPASGHSRAGQVIYRPAQEPAKMNAYDLLMKYDTAEAKKLVKMLKQAGVSPTDNEKHFKSKITRSISAVIGKIASNAANNQNTRLGELNALLTDINKLPYPDIVKKLNATCRSAGYKLATAPIPAPAPAPVAPAAQESAPVPTAKPAQLAPKAHPPLAETKRATLPQAVNPALAPDTVAYLTSKKRPTSSSAPATAMPSFTYGPQSGGIYKPAQAPAIPVAVAPPLPAVKEQQEPDLLKTELENLALKVPCISAIKNEELEKAYEEITVMFFKFGEIKTRITEIGKEKIFKKDLNEIESELTECEAQISARLEAFKEAAPATVVPEVSSPATSVAAPAQPASALPVATIETLAVGTPRRLNGVEAKRAKDVKLANTLYNQLTGEIYGNATDHHRNLDNNGLGEDIQAANETADRWLEITKNICSAEDEKCLADIKAEKTQVEHLRATIVGLGKELNKADEADKKWAERVFRGNGTLEQIRRAFNIELGQTKLSATLQNNELAFTVAIKKDGNVQYDNILNEIKSQLIEKSTITFGYDEWNTPQKYKDDKKYRRTKNVVSGAQTIDIPFSEALANIGEYSIDIVSPLSEERISEDAKNRFEQGLQRIFNNPIGVISWQYDYTAREPVEWSALSSELNQRFRKNGLAARAMQKTAEREITLRHGRLSFRIDAGIEYIAITINEKKTTFDKIATSIFDLIVEYNFQLLGNAILSGPADSASYLAKLSGEYKRLKSGHLAVRTAPGKTWVALEKNVPNDHVILYLFPATAGTGVNRLRP